MLNEWLHYWSAWVSLFFVLYDSFFCFGSFIYIYKYMTWCDYICALLPSAFLSLWPLSSSSLVPMSLWLKVCLPLLELPLNQQLFRKVWSPVDTFSITHGALRVPSLVQVSIYAVCSWWPWPCHSWVTAFCATPGSNFFILSSPSSMIFIKPGRVTEIACLEWRTPESPIIST